MNCDDPITPRERAATIIIWILNGILIGGLIYRWYSGA